MYIYLTMDWKSHPGPQERFHASPAFEVLYGGAAGGGKSDSLLIESLRYAHLPGYRGIIFRRSYPELEGKGSGIIPRSHELLDGSSARYDNLQHIWFFPNGGSLAFGVLEHLHSVHKYRSAQFAYIAFDELTTFLFQQYLYMFSRCRSIAGIPARVRAATNPGDIGHNWVRSRFIEKLKPFEIRYFKRDGDAEIETNADDPDALSRQFIPARVTDNPTLLAADPGYIQRLMALDAVDRERLLNGDWFAVDSGLVYRNFTDDNLTDEEPDPLREIELAYDDGYIDPRCFLLIQRTGASVLVFGELYHSHHLEETCISELLSVCEQLGVKPPALAIGSHEAVKLRARFRVANIPARGERVPLVESIKHLRTLFCDFNNVRSIRIHRRCANLLGELRGGYRYDPRGGEEPLDQDNHACDALRMWAWHRTRR